MRNFLMVPASISQLPIRNTAKMLLSDIANFDRYYKTRDLIADELGVSANYVSKMLSDLQREGYIEIYHTRGTKRCFRLPRELKQKVLEDLKVSNLKKSKALSEYDDNLLDLTNNCVVKSIDEQHNSQRDMDSIGVSVENIPHNNNKQYNRQEQTQYNYFPDKTELEQKLNKLSTLKDEEIVSLPLGDIDNASLSVLIYNLFRDLSPNSRKASPTLAKRVKVVSMFRQNFSVADILIACRNLAVMKCLTFGDEFNGTKWHVTFSWLTDSICLTDDSAFDKRINWLERGVNNEVEPDMTIAGVENWQAWKKEHKD